MGTPTYRMMLSFILNLILIRECVLYDWHYPVITGYLEVEMRPVTKNGKQLPDEEFVDNPEELVKFYLYKRMQDMPLSQRERELYMHGQHLWIS